MRPTLDLKTIFKSNRFFLIPYFIFIVLGAVLVSVNTKAGIHLAFNSHHNSFFDIFFYFITFLGDGIITVIVVIILLTIKFKYAIIAGISGMFSALLTQILKRTLFAEVVRPKKFFEGIHDLYFVPGVDNHLFNSFPSGHSTCAFSLYFALALMVKNNTYKLILCLLAILVAFSRVYLSQHFFEDIYAGSLIGVITTLIVFYFVERNDTKGLNNSLLNLFQ